MTLTIKFIVAVEYPKVAWAKHLSDKRLERFIRIKIIILLLLKLMRD